LHFWQRPFLPRNSSGIFSVDPHFGQVTLNGMVLLHFRETLLMLQPAVRRVDGA
jgi:hypothetical protein